VKNIKVPTEKLLYLVSGRSNLPLAEEIAAVVGVELGEPNLSEFANGEIHCRYGESIRGNDVFIVQSHTHIDGLTLNDSLMEQLIMVDAAKRASAKRITAVCPYYGYARQDRKAEGREPISAKLVADLFRTAGATRLVSVDLHSGQIQGFFDGPVDHLTAAPVLIDYIRSHLPSDLVVVSPDTGRVKVAEKYANKLGADIAIVHKRHVHGQKNEVEARELIGTVDGRSCVLIDDMIDTAGTICAAADLLLDRGASQVWAAATHGLFSGPAVDRLKNSRIDKIVVTNTLPLPSEKQFDKVEVLSVAPVIAQAIRAVFADASVSEIFDGDNLS
jgi:ribose-phosphate pyrophosphokinase